MSHVFMHSQAPRNNGEIEKVFNVQWFGLNAQFTVHEAKDSWEIADITLIEGDIDHVNEIVDTYMMHDYRFQADEAL